MSKFCIFCGQKPEKKNNEHVIPQWLSKMTGRYHKVCNLAGVTDKQISFSALQFPACTKCNEDFSALEADAKRIITSVLDAKPISAQEISRLLDWFDKIRVGLWLAELTLSQKVEEIDPNFYITERVGQKDRMLMVERLKDAGHGISFVGTNTAIFREMPSAFQLIINDCVFTNASENGLVSNKLGFPIYDKPRPDTGRGTVVTIRPGRNKTGHPVVDKYNASPTTTLIYQPMYKIVASQNIASEYDAPYVKEHSIDATNGVGGIFYQRGDNAVKYLGENEKLNITPRAQPMPETGILHKKVFDLQNYLLRGLYNLSALDSAGQQYYNALMQANKMHAKICEKSRR